MTSMRDSKWDKGQFEGKNRISDTDKEAIEKYYRAGLNAGRFREGLLEELAERYHRSDRQIERYISEVERDRDFELEQQKTVELHIEASRQLDEENRLTEEESKRQKEAQQIEHISDLQGLVRDFLDSIVYPADKANLNDLNQAQYALWQAFKRIIGDARWPMLAAHLGGYTAEFYNMAKRLEPPELKEDREHPGQVVITNTSIDDMIEIIDEAREFISNSPLDLIAEEADTEEWVFDGLKSRCQWCPIQM